METEQFSTEWLVCQGTSKEIENLLEFSENKDTT